MGMCTRNEKFALLLIYLITFTSLAINPVERDAWALENIVPLLEVIAAVVYFRWVELSRPAYYLIFLHVIIQVIGGHYTYAEVPAFNWLRDVFDLSRNHYDRLAHFAVGFCLYVPIREICLRRTPLVGSNKWAVFFTIATLTGVAGIWEVWEWIVAEVAYSSLGAAYLGQQGDIWDAQKDILLAPLGALAAMLIFTRWHNHSMLDAGFKYEAHLVEKA